MGKGDKLSREEVAVLRNHIAVLEEKLKYAHKLWFSKIDSLRDDLKHERGRYEELREKKLRKMKFTVVEHCTHCEKLLGSINAQIRERIRAEDDLEKELSRQSYLPNPNCKKRTKYYDKETRS